MRPVTVVVLDVLVDDGFEMSTAEDKHPVQTFTPDRADESFSEGVGTGSFDRGLDDADSFCLEDLVEAGSELGIAISDQELDRLRALGQFEAQVSGLLDDPGASRMCGHTL